MRFSIKYAPAFSVYRSGELKHSGHQYRDAPLGENIAGKTSTNMAAEYTGNNLFTGVTAYVSYWTSTSDQLYLRLIG